MKLTRILSADNITVTDGAKTVIASVDHPNFEAVLAAANKEETTIEQIEKLVNFSEALKYSSGSVQFSVKDGVLELRINGKQVNNIGPFLEKRIVETLRAQNGLTDFNMSVFANFVQKLYDNPSYKVVHQLYGFLAKNDLPLTKDGNFLAYKKVDEDYYDLHSHSILNKVGESPEMPRNEVEDDENKSCARGLHLCSRDYLAAFGRDNFPTNRVVVVEIDPRNVVSVPKDYSNAKMRVCKYTVIDEITDFEVSLVPYITGFHAKGWITDTLKKIKSLYCKFWDIKEACFNWRGTGEMPAVWENVPLRQKFIDMINEEFDLEQFKIEVDILQYICQPFKFFEFLSRLDTNSLPHRETSDDVASAE